MKDTNDHSTAGILKYYGTLKNNNEERKKKKERKKTLSDC